MARTAPARVNPDMLVWARRERGFNVDQAAKRIGVKSERLKACEKGEELLTFSQFRRAAEAYKRPSAVFFLREVPSSLVVPDFRRLPERLDEPLSPELRLEVRKIQQKRKAAVSLAQFGPEYDWSFIGSVAPRENPEEVGARVRAILGIPDSFPKGMRDVYRALNYWRDAIESTGTLVFFVTGVDVEEMRGLSIADRPFPTIGANRKDPPQARSFTLLHEFCHILLGESTLCDISERIHEDWSSSRLTEMFCNHVAGAALVPKEALLNTQVTKEHGLTEDWSESELQRLASFFRVSREVILRRLLIIGRTTPEFYGYKRQEWASRRPAKKPRVFGERGHEKVLRIDGLTYTRLVLNALGSDAISAGDASELLSMNLKHLSALEQLVLEKGK